MRADSETPTCFAALATIVLLDAAGESVCVAATAAPPVLSAAREAAAIAMPRLLLVILMICSFSRELLLD